MHSCGLLFAFLQHFAFVRHCGSARAPPVAAACSWRLWDQWDHGRWLEVRFPGSIVSLCWTSSTFCVASLLILLILFTLDCLFFWPLFIVAVDGKYFKPVSNGWVGNRFTYDFRILLPIWACVKYFSLGFSFLWNKSFMLFSCWKELFIIC